MKILLFAASLRKGSCNKKLIHVAAEQLSELGAMPDLADFAEFDMPLYNADVQNKEGFPLGMKKFLERLNQAEGLIIASPEYNFSTPGILKNLIDWVSREKPMPWAKRQILLMSASPSMVGGNRGVWHTRVPLEACGAFVFPEMFSLASAYQAFDEQGKLKDPILLERLRGNIEGFLRVIAQVRSL